MDRALNTTHPRLIDRALTAEWLHRFADYVTGRTTEPDGITYNEWADRFIEFLDASPRGAYLTVEETNDAHIAAVWAAEQARRWGKDNTDAFVELAKKLERS